MSDLEVALITLIPAICVLGGVALLWYASATGRSSTKPTLSIAARFVGGLLLLGGIVAAVIGSTLFFALIAIPVGALVLIVFIRRYYDAEQRSLMWGLLTAAERGIPLNVAAQSFADERHDRVGRKAAQLADFLEAGVPLGLALQRSGHRVGPAVSLAADLGYQTGTLGPALRQILNPNGVIDAITIPMASRLMYLGATVIATLIVETFLMLKILPIMERILFEFGGELPRSTQRLVASTQLGSAESYLWIAFVAVGLVGLTFGLASLLGSLRSFPVLRRLWWRVDCSLVMRWLATGIGQGRPILDMLRLLAGYFPQPAMRRALEKAALRVEQGSHWCDGLMRVRLVRPSEVAVFKAAERAGNLQWALQEMSDSAVRRWAYRLQVWMGFLFPAALIMLSCGVLAVLLGFFTPLITLIQELK